MNLRSITTFVIGVIGLLVVPALAQESTGETVTAAATPATSETREEEPPFIPTEAFSGQFEFGDAVLSPDRRLIAFTEVKDEATRLAFFDADTLEADHTIDLGKEFELNWFRWAGGRKIVYSVGTMRLLRGVRKFWITRLFLYDLDTKQRHYVGFPKQHMIGDDVIYIDPLGEHLLLDVSESITKWPEVWRYPLDGSKSDAATKVQKGKDFVSNWIADEKGVVRMGYGRLRSGRLYITYRPNAQSSWNRVARLNLRGEDSEKWDGIGLYAGSDIGYSIFKGENGREALFEFNYATGKPGRLVHEVENWDVEGVLTGPDSKLQGVTYTDDAQRVHWLDADMAKVQSQLERALGDGRVRIVSRSRNNERMLIWHGSSADPGAMYVFTPAQKRIELFASYRPEIDQTLLTKKRAFTYAARDGTEIRAFLTLPRRKEAIDLPLVILPHGGPFGVRDTLRYEDEVQLLANRGYAVLQPNYRGSGGYGTAFEEMGEGQIGRKMQDDLDDAMDWAVTEGIADKERVCVVGSSYGGYAALWAVTRNPERYRCAASWAGVTDWSKLLRYDRDYLGLYGYREQKKRVKGKGEDRIELDDYSPLELIEQLQRPVLLAHGKKDKRVPLSQYELYVKAAEKHDKDVESLLIEKAGHSFNEPEQEKAWYDALVAFLAKHNPAE